MSQAIAKGTAVELKLQALLLKEGYNICVPVGSKAYDLILELDNQFYKLQCKSGTVKNGALCFKAYSSRPYNKKYKYSKKDIDFLVSYHEERNLFYIIPIEKVKTDIVRLRLEKSKNNNKKFKNAKDYELLRFVKTLTKEDV